MIRSIRILSALLGSALLANGSDVAAAAAFRLLVVWGGAISRLSFIGSGPLWKLVTTKSPVIAWTRYFRTHPGFPEADELFAALKSDPTGREVLLEHLASKPRWLFRYMKMDSTTPFDVVQRRVDMLEVLGNGKSFVGLQIGPWHEQGADRARRARTRDPRVELELPQLGGA